MSETQTTSNPPSEPLRVPTALAVMVDQLASLAWAKLGLQPDPLTGKIEPDLVDAKLAIDCMGDLIARLTPSLDADDRRQVENLLRDLRVNYVSRAGSAE
jgi:hypothetical protein